MSYIGTTKVGGLYLGNTKIAKAYLGGDLVYEKQSGGIVLPTGYTLLNYINANSNAYFGISISPPYDVEVLAQPVSLYGCIIGAAQSLQLAMSNGYASVGNANSSSVFFSSGTDALIEGRFSSTQSETFYKVDGVDTGLHRAVTQNTLNIFSSSGKANITNCNIYYVKVFVNGELYIHLVPCLNSYNTPVFYDVINNVTKTINNAGQALYG